MTYLFDQQKAMDALAPFEKQWGGTLAERTARRAAAIRGSGPARIASGRRDMISSAIIPAAAGAPAVAADLAGRAICTIGLITLYSAAGGSVSPWALKQALTILVFLGVAIGMSLDSRKLHQAADLPGLCRRSCSCWSLVEMVGFVGKGAQRWVDLGFIRLQPSRIHEAGDRAGAGALLRPAAGRRRPPLARRCGRRPLLVGVPAGLILVQPDLGTAMMVAARRRHRDVHRRPADVVFRVAGGAARGGRADRCSA